MHWGRKRPGDPGHAPRIGAGNGALGQANCLPQCLFSCPNAAHRTRVALQPWSRATECAQERAVGAQIRPTGIISGADRLRPTHAPSAPRFHSDTAIRVGGSAGLSRTAALFSQQYHTLQALQHLQSDGIPLKTPLHVQTTPAPAQRQRNVGIPGESSCNPPQRARLPFENTASLAKHPEPPALDHSALRDKGTSSASTSPARSWANAGPHWGRKQRVGAGNRSLGQANNLPQCRLTCPNAD